MYLYPKLLKLKRYAYHSGISAFIWFKEKPNSFSNYMFNWCLKMSVDQHDILEEIIKDNRVAPDIKV
jgi:hypothetical protein